MSELRELATEDREACAVRGLPSHTIDSYRVTLTHLVRHFPDAGPEDINHRKVARFLAARRETGDADTTLANRHATLRAFWTWLVNEDEVETNVVKRVPRPTVKRTPVPLVAEDGVSAMLRLSNRTPFLTHRNRAILFVLFDCGVRVGELVSIELKGVDWTHLMIRVSGKSGKRDVPFGKATASALRRYLRHRSRHPQSDSPYLFVGTNESLHRDTVLKMVRRYAERADVGRVWPHKLRHSWVDALLRSGASVMDAQYLGGWSSPQQVMTRYGIAGKRERAIAAHRKHSPGDRL
ncbi:tyrosine-type recombinase/integrase [Nocardiopsis rhodophaea]|uniref:tyrosine-type recombinase/integrase n=1 Tax=Nocardiopsis rhodophaea TaxID=280238 RepID=UPI0031D8DDC8